MKVTDPSKLTYPCYLKDPIVGDVLYVERFRDNIYVGHIVQTYEAKDSEWNTKYFTILCDKDGNEIDLPEEQKSVEEMTIEAAQQKIAELQAFVQKKKEESELYSSDELINSNEVLEGLYRNTSGSFAIVDEAGYAMWISAGCDSIQSLVDDTLLVWKRVKKFKIEVIE